MDNYQPVQPKKTNGMCIAGLICAFLVPILGLIFSIVGLNQAKNRNEDGRGLAIAGIIISVIEMIMAIVITVFMISAFMYVVEDATHERRNYYYDNIDVLPPNVTVRDKTIYVGERVRPEDFILECYDSNGCNYSFFNEQAVSNYTAPGVYTLMIIVSDDVGNQTSKEVTLTIIDPEIINYYKHVEFDEEKGYEYDEAYEISFSDYSTHRLLDRAAHKIVYKYRDNNIYQSDKEKYAGEPGYKFDDTNKKITYTESSKTIGNGYTTPKDIDYYLVSEGFKKD